MDGTSAESHGPLRVGLDGAAARRLLSTVLATASHSSMTAARAGAVQALATQLGLSFQVVAELAAAATVVRPASRAEAEATYLATAVVVGSGAPDRGTLAQLGAALDLGVATRELDRLASSAAPLVGLTRDGTTSSSGERRAAARRTGDSSGARTVSSRRARVLSGALPAAAGSWRARGSRWVGAACARHPLPVAACVVVAAGLLGSVGVLVARQRPAAERAVVLPLRARYDDAIRAWNEAIARHTDVVPFDMLAGIHDVLVELRDEGRVGSPDEVALAATITSFVDAGELAVEWRKSIEQLQEQTDDALQLEAQHERFEEARRRIDRLPRSVSTTWRQDRLQKVDAWVAYATRVRGFLSQHAGARGVEDLRRALFLFDEAGVAKGGRAHADLTRWFREQRASSDELFAAYLHATSREDERTLITLLQLVETDVRAYLARKTPAELEQLADRIARSAWLGPLERAALRARLLGR